MIELTNDQKRILLENGIEKHWQITVFDGDSPDFTIPTSKMVDNSLSIKESLCTSDYLELGSCESAIFSIKLADLEATALKGKKITVALSASDGTTSVNMAVGTFWVDDVTHPNNSWYYQITAYDNMCKFDAKAYQWYSNLQFPMTLQNFRTSLCSFVGVATASGQTLPLDDLVIKKYTNLDVNITARQILQAIAEINGCFAHVNRSGQLVFKYLGSTSCITLSEGGTNHYKNGATHENWQTSEIGAVITYSLSNEQGITYPSTGGTNAYTLSDNFLCYDMTDAELTRVARTVYEALEGITYTAHSTPTDGRLWLEAGDMISLESDGQTIETYILSRTFTGFQAFEDTFEARATDPRKNDRNSTQQQIERLKRDADEIRATYLRADVAEITYATIENLSATNAIVENLEADNVLINGRLTAAEADIQTLDADKANVTDLTAATARIGSLEADVASFHQTYTTDLTAVHADIQTLTSTTAQIGTLVAGKADIADLNAVSARVGLLESDVAYVDTLMFGSATGTSIQTSFANAVIAQLGNAQIKDAMIDSVSANKISAGSIYTNIVHIYGDTTNKLTIVDNTISISDGSRVRVQIGKDANNDYNMYVWDGSGNLMFDAAGITTNGITRKVIRNDVVQDNANIAASKLDIASLFTVINSDTSHTLKGSKIKLDTQNQTLDVAFTSLSTTVTNQGTTISSQGTAISTIQGQISSKIWQQDIDTASASLTQTMNTQYSTLTQTINGVSSQVGTLQSTLANDYSTTTQMNTAIDQTAGRISSEANARLEATVGYSSKNLLEITNTTKTQAGVTFTVDKSAGTITASNTCTASEYTIYTIGSIVNTSDTAMNLYMSGCADGGSTSKYYVYAYDTTTNARPKKWNGSSSSGESVSSTDKKEIQILPGHTVQIRILVKTGYPNSTITFKPMVCDGSITNNTFEPYHSVQAQFSDTYSRIEQTADSIALSVSKKVRANVGYDDENLIDFNSLSTPLTTNGITFTVDKASGSVTANGTATAIAYFNIPVSVTGNYYLSGGADGGSDTTYDVYAIDVTAGARPKKHNGTDNSDYLYDCVSGSEVQYVSGHDNRVRIRIRSGVTVDNVVFSPAITAHKKVAFAISDSYSRITQTANGIMLSAAQLAYGQRTKNLIPFILGSAGKTLNGITIKRYGTGYKLTGTATANAYFTVYTTDASVVFDNSKLPNKQTLPNGSYIVSGGKSNGVVVGFGDDIKYYIEKGTSVSNYTRICSFSGETDGKEFTVATDSEQPYVRHYIWIRSGTDMGTNGTMVYPMIRDATIPDSSYTPGVDSGAYICSAINLTPEKLELDAGKLVINAGNFQLDSSGNATIGGNGVIQSGNYVQNTSGMKITLSDGAIDSKNFKVSSNGTVTMTGGTIETTNYTAASGSTKTVGGKINLSATGSTLLFDTANFKITGAGAVTAEDATLTGGIIKTSNYAAASGNTKTVGGKINLSATGSTLLFDTANFKITGAGAVTITDLTLTGGTIQSSNFDTTAGTGTKINLSNGVISTGSGKFNVSSAGAVTASAITIKNFDASKTLMSISSSNAYLRSANYSSNSTGMKINLADGSIDSKNFKVSSTGVLTASGATITGSTFTVESTTSEAYLTTYVSLKNTYTKNNITYEYETKLTPYGLFAYDTQSSSSSTVEKSILVSSDSITLTSDDSTYGGQLALTPMSLSISTDNNGSSSIQGGTIMAETLYVDAIICYGPVAGTALTCSSLNAASSLIVINAPLTFANGTSIRMADKEILLIATKNNVSSLTLGISTLPLKLYGSSIWANHSISTGSDLRIKEDVGQLDHRYLDLIKQITPAKFRYKGISNDALHTGFIAQEVLGAMAQTGLKPDDLGLFVDIAGDGSNYALRYDEFAALLLLYIKDLEKQIHNLKS